MSRVRRVHLNTGFVEVGFDYRENRFRVFEVRDSYKRYGCDDRSGAKHSLTQTIGVTSELLYIRVGWRIRTTSARRQAPSNELRIKLSEVAKSCSVTSDNVRQVSFIAQEFQYM